MCNEKLLFQVHSRLLSFLSQIGKDFEKEVYVGKQNIKSKKKYFCLITSALPLFLKHIACPEHSFMGQMEIFVIFLIYKWRKTERNLSENFLHYKLVLFSFIKILEVEIQYPIKTGLGKKSLERCLKGKMSLRFNWLSLNLSSDRSWEFIPYLHCPLQFWVEMPK